jgi:choline dehydrogenase-like flavoprotein
MSLWVPDPRPWNKQWTIALIERGGGDSSAPGLVVDPLTRPLHRWFAASHQTTCRNTSLTTGYLTVHTTTASSSKHWSLQRLVDVPVGIGLGGSSLINAGLVIPPAASDFADWPLLHNVLPTVSTILHAMHDAHCVHSSTSSVVVVAAGNDAKKTSTLVSSKRCSPVFTSLPIVGRHEEKAPSKPAAATAAASSRGFVWKEMTFPSTCLDVPGGGPTKPSTRRGMNEQVTTTV